ncbi:Hypothetical protein NTJ_00264 [Nesidiocoris tenuis]|uniref:Uncharacterized protein n=1 Tax=Nesidiocoris tenuis TaxID=355587 RepID=A0ABN7A5R0_9HEMI|nr:Hypothetical protein NTJ_00264 [Nesidiocoris tenuis]
MPSARLEPPHGRLTPRPPPPSGHPHPSPAPCESFPPHRPSCSSSSSHPLPYNPPINPERANPPPPPPPATPPPPSPPFQQLAGAYLNVRSTYPNPRPIGCDKLSLPVPRRLAVLPITLFIIPR